MAQGSPVLVRYIVSRSPPWYEIHHKDNRAFSCHSSQGLFDIVKDAMDREAELLSQIDLYRPEVVKDLVRDAVATKLSSISHRPCRSLVLAMMDLVDVLEGDEFDSLADRGGLKEVLVTLGNYTAYNVPKEELKRRSGKIVVPVVTHYDTNENLVFADPMRSMIGTYYVSMAKGPGDNKNAYFLQEVLVTPGLDSLKLIRAIAGTRFEFWDMSLEIPTHKTALTPCFALVQSDKILHQDSGETDQARERQDSTEDDVLPLCCEPEVDAGPIWAAKGTSTYVCYTQQSMKCNLTCFGYEDDRDAELVVCARALTGKKQGTLLPIVSLRPEQQTECESPLYVSTTLRLYKAFKRVCMRGTGKLSSCWKEILKELDRTSYLSGPLVFQDVYCAALAAFNKCVNPNGWRCLQIPRHVKSYVRDSAMKEILELAADFMEAKIPNAFAVAELLHCNDATLNKCVAFQNRFLEDAEFNATVRAQVAAQLERLIDEESDALSLKLREYAKTKDGPRDEKLIQAIEACATTLANRADVSEVHKLWHKMLNVDPSKKDEAVKELYGAGKVTVFKLKLYHSKLKKYKAAATSSPKPGSHPKDPKPKKSSAEVSLLHVTPEYVPLSGWISNMRVLLTSIPWLHKGNRTRRNAICTLLNLSNTLLREETTLREWVAANWATVKILKDHGVEDYVSSTLIRTMRHMCYRKTGPAQSGTFHQKAKRGVAPKSHHRPVGRSVGSSGAMGRRWRNFIVEEADDYENDGDEYDSEGDARRVYYDGTYDEEDDDYDEEWTDKEWTNQGSVCSEGADSDAQDSRSRKPLKRKRLSSLDSGREPLHQLKRQRFTDEAWSMPREPRVKPGKVRSRDPNRGSDRSTGKQMSRALTASEGSEDEEDEQARSSGVRYSPSQNAGAEIRERYRQESTSESDDGYADRQPKHIRARPTYTPKA